MTERIPIASDHAGFELKAHLAEALHRLGYEVVDHGPVEYDALDDYPPYCLRAGQAVVADPGSLGIVIGGSGGAPVAAPAPSAAGAAGANAVVAPLAGSVARILVAEGDEVEAGQVLLVLEAMKMETEITAPAAGAVSAILVKQGEPVQGGQALIEL